jgi:hypothetical protein
MTSGYDAATRRTGELAGRARAAAVEVNDAIDKYNKVNK